MVHGNIIQTNYSDILYIYVRNADITLDVTH